MIRVLIADDQMLIRQGIRTLLEMDRDIAVVGEAADGAETVDKVLALGNLCTGTAAQAT
jgi:DNA-binding NarL/FixJ family response regulator